MKKLAFSIGQFGSRNFTGIRKRATPTPNIQTCRVLQKLTFCFSYLRICWLWLGINILFICSVYFVKIVFQMQILISLVWGQIWIWIPVLEAPRNFWRHVLVARQL